jgi:hypothetical protein
MGLLGWIIGWALRIVVLTIRAVLYTLVGDLGKWSEILEVKD